jgi:hypothetical protein
MTVVNAVSPYQHGGPFVRKTYQILSWCEERGQPYHEPVMGWVNGPFGYHQTAEWHLSLTHLPTGLRIALFESPPFDTGWVRDVFVPQVALLFSPTGELLDADAVRGLVKQYQQRGPWA